MSPAYFDDPKRRPTEAAILEAVGRAAPAWRELFAQLEARQPDLQATWNYYRDGKSWLLKVTRGAKTVFWLSVDKGAFRVAFYFPDRLTPALLDAALSKKVRDQLAEPAKGKLRAVRVEFGPKAGVRDVLALLRLKTSASRPS